MCGKDDVIGKKLHQCSKCIASFHSDCTDWVRENSYRYNYLPQMFSPTGPFAELHRVVETGRCCQVCTYGPRITYADLVWHRIHPWPFWPARVLQPGELPARLIKQKPYLGEYLPLKFYDDVTEFTWANEYEVCRLMCHDDTSKLSPQVTKHYLRACDDFIPIYVAGQLNFH